jgi:aspartate kinase
MKKIIEILKFGGGSIKDAKSIKQLVEIVKKYPNVFLVLVISAIGKTTDKLENLVKEQEEKNFSKVLEIFEDIYNSHISIVKELFPEDHDIHSLMKIFFNNLQESLNFCGNFHHSLANDQIVSHGEYISSMIISHYLKFSGVDNKFIFAPKVVFTDSHFGEAKVNEEETFLWIDELAKEFKEKKVLTTQGFLGGFGIVSTNCSIERNFFVTTLGREGSDYSAAIFAVGIYAKQVTLFKDVPGIMDKNPNVAGGEHAKLFKKLSYKRCKDLLDGTAKGVIHPKTVDLLEKYKIPLRIKSFWHPELPGTLIS